MTRKKTVPLCEDAKTGKKYVEVDAIMPLMIACCCGLRITAFADDDPPRWYLDIDDAIEWCRKETGPSTKDRYDKIIAVLERFKRGENVEYNN